MPEPDKLEIKLTAPHHNACLGSQGSASLVQEGGAKGPFGVHSLEPPTIAFLSISSLQPGEQNYKHSSAILSVNADLTEAGTVTTDAGAGVTAREQTAGNYKEAPFPGSHCSLADKEVSISGRDVALCCLPSREQREHYPPAASGLIFFH